MISDLQYYVLCVLKRDPAYGYEIYNKVIKLSENPYQLNGPIYKTLWVLERDGFVVKIVNYRVAGRQRILYDITPSGLAVLMERHHNYRHLVQVGTECLD